MIENFNILVVDDDNDNVCNWCGILEKEGRKFYKAHSGYEAMRMVISEDIHLVLTDIDMPVEKGPQMNGLELIKEIKKQERDIYVIFAVDDQDSIDDVVHGLEDGAVDYLIEPLHPKITKAKVAIFETLYRKRQALLHEQKKSEELLRNILPQYTIDELKKTGKSTARQYKKVSVLFTDFVNFTMFSEKVTPQYLIEKLNRHFSIFDGIMDKWNIEKIKTIGDSYMAAGGVPIRNQINPVTTVLAALEINKYMLDQQALDPETWEIRIGIHTGPLVSGIVGLKKYQYDIWGDTVNTASRMESKAEVGRVNVSHSTYLEIKEYFICTPRGKLVAKNKGLIDMYFVDRLKPEYTAENDPIVPNEKLHEIIHNN